MRERVPFLCRFWHRWIVADQTPHLEACRRCGKVRRREVAS